MSEVAPEVAGPLVVPGRCAHALRPSPTLGRSQVRTAEVAAKFAQCIFRVVKTGLSFGFFLLKRGASDQAQVRFLNVPIAELRVFLRLIPAAQEV